MLYAIKADEEILYVGCTDNPKEEYLWHYKNYMESKNDSPCAPDDFYFMLGYYKDAEHKTIKMVELDAGGEDEEVVCDILIRAIRPIGNVMDWEVHFDE